MREMKCRFRIIGCARHETEEVPRTLIVREDVGAVKRWKMPYRGDAHAAAV